jgi:UDP-N-acetylmuramyl pentapeptide phosphotransferase/UDP-N-acetylglucosamine-1-phosphate transferase
MNALESHPANLVLVLFVAGVISAALVMVLRPLLQRYALARPNSRSSHKIPTPQGGGIAVIAATLLASGACMGLVDSTIPGALFGATLFIALVGFVDDIKPIPVVPRLLLQAIAVGAVLWDAPAELRLESWLPLGVERILLLIAGLWFVNLVNFMDGLDLMTAAEAVPITGALMLFAWLGHYPVLPGLIAAALCGAMLGFAPFNRPIAKVFLGDVGSLPIGLLLGFCLLQLAWDQHLTAALLLPLYYLADATLTLLRRIAKGEPFWAAHRSHYYQRATDNGFTVKRVVSETFALNLLLAALGSASIAFESGAAKILLLAAGSIAVAFLLHRFGQTRSDCAR